MTFLAPVLLVFACSLAASCNPMPSSNAHVPTLATLARRVQHHAGVALVGVRSWRQTGEVARAIASTLTEQLALGDAPCSTLEEVTRALDRATDNITLLCVRYK